MIVQVQFPVGGKRLSLPTSGERLPVVNVLGRQVGETSSLAWDGDDAVVTMVIDDAELRTYLGVA